MCSKKQEAQYLARIVYAACSVAVARICEALLVSSLRNLDALALLAFKCPAVIAALHTRL